MFMIQSCDIFFNVVRRGHVTTGSMNRMKGTLGSSDSKNQSGEDVISRPAAQENTTSNLQSFTDLPPVHEDERTVISQRPVAAPDEFLRSMPLSELATLLEGKRLDHFQVNEMIGGGGMGAVFRGQDLRLDRTVAIKVIPASKRDADTMRRFRQEAQSAARLDHPNIARVYYVGEAERWNYIVFEFIAGVNIRDLVDVDGPLSIDDAVFYTRQVAEALQHATERNVVHRDIKPSNVLVTPEGAAKVVDMGLARDTSMDKSSADATASGVTLGTFDYISPEQARNPRDADVRSDLYSLGCTLFFMLTGNPPFPEGTALQKLLNHGSQPPPDPRAWRDDMSDELYEILMKLMAKRPGDRYQKPIELINDLLLLAEAEDLPRSRTPGLMLLSPTAVQRSLLETNLPWMVGIVVLLGSAVSVQAISSSFRIPPASFTLNPGLSASEAESSAVREVQDNSSIEARTVPGNFLNETNRTEPNELPVTDSATVRNANSFNVDPVDVPLPEPPTGDSPPRTITALVVSEVLPTGVNPDAWSNSLERAIKKSEFETEIRSIEIAGRIVADGPIRIGRNDLLIRAARLPSGHKPEATIEFSQSAVARLQPGEGLIHIGDKTLQCLDLNLNLRLQGETASKELTLFELSGQGKLELEGCRVTIRSPLLRSHIISVTPDVPSLGLNAPPINPRSLHPTSVTLRNCVMRGDTSMLRVEVSRRIELDLKSSLLALTGFAIEVHGVEAEDKMPPVMRIYCQNSTFATAEGFAKIAYRRDAAPSMGINRNSSSCVYWSQSGKAHMLVEGLMRADDLDDLMHLQGGDNAYDSQIDELCKCRARDQSEVTFQFSGAQTEWFREHGNEWSVSWRKPIPSADTFFQLSDSDLAVTEGMFMPGFTPPGDASEVGD
jgi:eukaryotic-like serine/threonine-protein kinase